MLILCSRSILFLLDNINRFSIVQQRMLYYVQMEGLVLVTIGSSSVYFLYTVFMRSSFHYRKSKFSMVLYIELHISTIYPKCVIISLKM